MGNGPSQPDALAYGQAKLTLALDDRAEGYRVSCTSTWYTPDGQLSEASLDLTGADGELYDVLSECTSWLYRRWKRPLTRALAETPGPFDGRQP